MRVAVVHPQAAFMSGGAESHVRGLVDALKAGGHDAEAVTIPFKWYPPSEIVHQMGMWRSLDLTESNGMTVDMVIAMKFPAYLIRHPNKVLWLIHQHRTAYELWDHPEYGDLSRFADGPIVRDMIVTGDRRAFAEATKIFTNSANVAGRLQRSLGIEGEVLYHRSPLSDVLHGREPGPIGDAIVSPSRFDKLKRQSYAVEAMRHVRSDVRLILVGAGPEKENLEKQIANLGLDDRVELRERIPDEELIDLYRNALGVYFGPFDEDYGYITIEGMAAARPVIVTTDAGGPLEFVRPGETGLTVEPEPTAIAAAFDALFADRARAKEMGDAGRAFFAEHVPDWAGVVARLLG
jgi:glycosyltransferase involved in cell wall biosynthesis